MEKRIKVKLKNPNPLFEKWLREWIDEAEKKRKKSSKVYQKAFESLIKYPLTLWSGHDCAILEGFGAKICDMLQAKLEEYLRNCTDLNQQLCFKDKIKELQTRHYDEITDLVTNIEAANLIENSTICEKSANNLSMIEEEEKDDVEMKEVSSDEENIEPPIEETETGLDDSLDFLIRKYQLPKKEEIPEIKICNSEPFDSPVTSKRPLKKNKSFNTNIAGPSYASSPIPQNDEIKNPRKRLGAMKYAADDCLSPIISSPEKRRKIESKKNEVILSPPKFVDCQQEIVEDEEKFITVDDIDTNDYEVILIIDIGEAKSKTSCEVQSKITKKNPSVKSEIKKLHIGDFVWMAAHKTDKSKTFVLPYIIERKRLDDLAKSIKDKRFHEQKFRLKQCGIENVIYLVENLKATNFGLPFETLTQAVSNTLIHNRFQVKFTDDSDHTALYLAILSAFITSVFHKKQPVKFKLMDFESFNQGSVKQKKCTVRETFIKQLLTIKGLSVQAALEITKYFPTPSHLMEKYSNLTKKEGENLLTKITFGELNRKIPSNVSKILYNFYMQ